MLPAAIVAAMALLLRPGPPTTPSSVQTTASTRRDALLGAAAAALAFPAEGRAYDSIAPVQADLADLEKKRKAREEVMKRAKQEIKPLLRTISSATTPAEYSDSVDQLTVWLIGKGSLPEGIEAGAVRDVIQDTYESLPQKGYACEMTRTNKGVCFSPGEPADSAYKTSIAQLRKYATRKGKGSLMSDGVSAANSAAF